MSNPSDPETASPRGTGEGCVPVYTESRGTGCAGQAAGLHALLSRSQITEILMEMDRDQHLEFSDPDGYKRVHVFKDHDGAYYGVRYRGASIVRPDIKTFSTDEMTDQIILWIGEEVVLE